MASILERQKNVAQNKFVVGTSASGNGVYKTANINCITAETLDEEQQEALYNIMVKIGGLRDNTLSAVYLQTTDKVVDSVGNSTTQRKFLGGGR